MFLGPFMRPRPTKEMGTRTMDLRINVITQDKAKPGPVMEARNMEILVIETLIMKALDTRAFDTQALNMEILITKLLIIESLIMKALGMEAHVTRAHVAKALVTESLRSIVQLNRIYRRHIISLHNNMPQRTYIH